jgi:formylmethanofuran dehydrogenase subunit C
VGGSHTFFTAPSGTAGNAITFTQSLAVGLGTTLALEGATSAAGTGIAFPATQLASSNANTFDDFERANWTPTQGAGLTVVGTFSSSGRYVKKGNEVTITGTISGSTSIAFSAGGIICAGIPFATGFDSAGTFVASTNTSGGQIRVSSVSITAATAQGAVTSVTFTATYIV